MQARRSRRIEPRDPGGEPVCLLTPEAARRRRVPIDHLLSHGIFEQSEAGYEISLPLGETYWALANDFAEEEAKCCAALAIAVEERDTGIVVRASF